MSALLGWAVLPVASIAQPASVPFRPPPHYVSGTKPDADEGSRALEELRATGLAGGYWLEFQLRVLPRKGDESLVQGRIFGMRGEQGPLTRLSVFGPTGAVVSSWLIRGGPQPAVWVSAAGAPARQLGAVELFQPIAGTGLTPFDLQMPFLYWPDWAYEGIAKVRGRPASSFLLYPPADLAAAHPELTAVRVALDTQFHAMVLAEFLGATGQSAKTITVLDLKKSGEQWLVKSIDLRDAATRDKTRFEVTAAALNLTLAPEIFSPESLAGALPPPAGVTPEKL